VLAVPTGADDSSGHLITVVVAEILKYLSGSLHQRLLTNLHPLETTTNLIDKVEKKRNTVQQQSVIWDSVKRRLAWTSKRQ